MCRDTKKRFFFLITFWCMLGFQSVHAQMTIDSIIVEQSMPAYGSFADSWKTSTIAYPDHSDIILISGLKQGQEAGEFEWKKAEEALRSSGLFRKVRIEIDTIDARNVTVYINHELALPMEGPGIYLEIGGSVASIGGVYQTKNISGSLIDVQALCRNRTEHGIGPELRLSGVWSNAMHSAFSLGFGLTYHQFTQGFTASGSMNADPMGGLFLGASVQSREGIDFLLEGPTQLISHEYQEYSAWGGWLLPRKDNLYFSVKASIRDAKRGMPKTIQAFDNTQSLLLGFGSLADRTRIIHGEEIPIGAWGSAVLGKILPSLEGGGESYYYVGGTVEQSELTLNNALYLKAKLSAGSGLLQGKAKNTALEARAQAQYMIQPTFALMFHMNARTTWNWSDFRQLVLDNEAGIRGLPVNGRIGNNMVVFNVMLAKDAMYLTNGLRIGFSAFADLGTVWNSGISIMNSFWNSSLGGGILVLAEGRSMQTGQPLLRIEYAHVLQGGGGIVISTNYPFSLFTKHQYELPAIIGDAIDTE